MKTNSNLKKIFFAGALVCAVFAMQLSHIANAAAVQSSKLVAPVKAGSLQLTVPGSSTISSIDVSATDLETTGIVNDIQVTDLRGKKTPLGWSLTVTATNFQTIDSDLIPIARFKMAVSQYKFINGADGGIVVPGTVSFIDGNNDGVSDAATLLFAKPGFGAGQFSISPILKLLVPAFTVAGDYQSTLTLTIS